MLQDILNEENEGEVPVSFLSTNETPSGSADKRTVFLSAQTSPGRIQSIVKNWKQNGSPDRYIVEIPEARKTVKNGELGMFGLPSNAFIKRLVRLRALENTPVLVEPFMGSPGSESLFHDFGPNPNALGLQVVNTFLGGMEHVEGDLFPDPVRDFVFLGEDRATMVFWNEDGSRDSVEMPMSDRVKVWRRDGTAREVDLTENSSIEIDGSPRFVTGLPSELLKTFLSLSFVDRNMRFQDTIQELTLQFRNHFSRPISEAELNIKPPEHISIESGGSPGNFASFNAANIEENEQVQMGFSIRISPRAQPGSMPFDIDLKFRFEGKEKTRTFQVARDVTLNSPLDVSASLDTVNERHMAVISVSNSLQVDVNLDVEATVGEGRSINRSIRVPSGQDGPGERSFRIYLREEDVQNGTVQLEVLAQQTAGSRYYARKNFTLQTDGQ